MHKRLIYLLLIVLLVIVTSCDNSPNSDVISYKDLSSFKANIYDAKGLGISVQNKGYTINNAVSRDSQNTQHYLMMTNEYYDSYSVEYNSTELTAVSFSRILETGDEQTISQDSVDGEIDKLYVSTDYTLVSYVPVGTSQRPNTIDYAENESMDCESYDLSGYYSDNTRASFVISNTTGKIYSIPEGKTFNVHNRVVYEKDMGPVYFSISKNDQLIITSIVRNNTISVIDYFRDCYGKYYILNDSLSGIDPDYPNALFFIWAGEYVPAKNGKVLKCSYEYQVWCDPPSFTSICYVGENFTDEEDIKEDVEINYKPYLGYGEGKFYTGYSTYMCIKDGYMYTLNGGSWYNYGRFNLETKERINLSMYTGGSYSGFIGHLDYQTILVGWDMYHNKEFFSLYCFNVYEQCKNLGDLSEEFLSEHVLLPRFNYSSSMYEYNDCFNPFEWEFRVDDFSSTKYYKVIRDENELLGYGVIETKNYNAEVRKIILQPINAF